MGLALDEPKPEDKQIDKDGLLFLLDAQISRWLEYGDEVLIDYNERWERFRVHIAGASAC
mgnify:CR=1 FL=1